MSLKCKLGSHTWCNCKCTQCGKIRDEQHDWTKDCEKCSECGKSRENQHDWTTDCEKCSKCDKIREGQHDLINNICKICGQGIFIDNRDGNRYKIIKVGNQIIMAENLRYKMDSGCWAYENNEEIAKETGYLYDWETAKKAAENIEDWHLSTTVEWLTMYDYLNNSKNTIYNVLKHSDSYSFDTLAGGFRQPNGTFSALGKWSLFWSIASGENQGWRIDCSADDKLTGLANFAPSFGLSIRLFRDSKFA